MGSMARSAERQSTRVGAITVVDMAPMMAVVNDIGTNHRNASVVRRDSLGGVPADGALNGATGCTDYRRESKIPLFRPALVM